MQKFLLALLCWFALASVATGQIVYEDFEGNDVLNWNPIQGHFEVVENPFPEGINTSANVGSYTKDTTAAYSLFLVELDEPIDLSVNNQFSIQINSPVPTSFILKLEGPNGAVEATKNIPVGGTNKWREYTFDFSSRATLQGLNKIILFFDPGVTTSGDTYLFDNLIARPAGPCAGTVADPMVLDDFECQRNATYGQGYDSLSVVANPAPDAVNSSASVGLYKDPTGEPYAALVVDFGNPIDLSRLNIFKVKIWSPKVVRFGFKLEGGSSPAIERTNYTVPATEEWVEYKIDFSDQAAANHTRFVIFFNFAENAQAGDIYYIDDLVRMEASQAAAIEDFEEGGRLEWEPLGGNGAVHGTFDIVANPDRSGANDSENVGAHTKGSSPNSTLEAFLVDGLDLSENSQLNLQVWAPAGATSVEMLLNSPLQGLRSATANIPATEEWVDLAFDFSNSQTVTDFESVQLRFNPGQASPSGTFYFDNLSQGESTVDPCEGVEPVPNIIDNFECQRHATYGAGAGDLEVVNNPDITAANGSAKVGKYTDPVNEPYAALGIQYTEPIDLSLYNQFSIKIWSPIAVPIGFKLEDGTAAPVEIVQDVTATNSWQTYTVDFSAQAGGGYKRLVIFFNFGVTNPNADVYYIDDLRWARAPYTACVETYQNEALAITQWTYFANGDGNSTEFEIVDNPSPDAVNPSDKVGIFIESATGASDLANFAGMFTRLEAPIILPESKTMRMKVLADHEAQIAFKLEGSVNGAPNSGDVLASYTTPGQWQEITWNYPNLPVGGQYQTIALIFDFENIPTSTKMYYFDDIVVGNENCIVTSTHNVQLEKLRISPNPATESLFIENAEKLQYVEIYNTLGQLVNKVQLNRSVNEQLNISTLSKGMFILAGYDASGKLIANAKFVKE